ncbi:DUF2169 family type VI secretion system accessory protein [Aliivibrio fischeri]|uniref:DUF2169 family type VI secretion system accessory protein n=1 Tax=Aliivibrio fischeri TaxID=668 RepID=UPI000907EC9C|nr:DUF2169 domain-containing protein [Aliivibrio fischeri]
MQLWDIDSESPFTLKGRFQRDSEGHEVWVLSMKRAWTFLDGSWSEEVDNLELNDDPIYLGEPGFSAMVADHDFPIYKKNTDVLIYGKARSYAKKPVHSQLCRVLIDEHIDKTLKVVGERHWVDYSGSITVSTTQSFIERDIDYSNAIGGDERNRIGGGAAETNAELLKAKVPSIFYPDQNWQASSKKVKVAGFGPMPPFFHDRAKWAGTFDEKWFEERRPVWPIDFDDRFYQSAPQDQQCNGYLQGGERLMVSGFCHNDALSFRIPSEKFQAVAVFNGKEEKINMPMYTLWIDTENKRIEATYTAAFPCQNREHLLTSSYLVELP